MCVLQNVGPHKLGTYPQVLKVSFMNLTEKCGFRNQTKVCPKSMGALLVARTAGLKRIKARGSFFLLFTGR